MYCLLVKTLCSVRQVWWPEACLLLFEPFALLMRVERVQVQDQEPGSEQERALAPDSEAY